MGVALLPTKLIAFATGASFAGIMGVISAAKQTFISPESFVLTQSISILSIVVLGGLGSIPGVILGAAIVTLLNISLLPSLGEAITSLKLPQEGQPRAAAAPLFRADFGDNNALPSRRAAAHRAPEPHFARRQRGKRGGARLHQSRYRAARYRRGDSRRRSGGQIVNRPLLEVRELSKTFGGLKAVSEVTLDIPRQSIISVIGPNGAGKTTFFNVITGIYSPTSSSIRLDGQNPVGLRPDQVTAAGIARTFQNIRLFAAMDCRENVMVGRHCRMKVGYLDALLRTRRFYAAEAEAGEVTDLMLDLVGLEKWRRELATNLICPTASSANSRLPARWRTIPSSSCWTNLPPA